MKQIFRRQLAQLVVQRAAVSAAVDHRQRPRLRGKIPRQFGPADGTCQIVSGNALDPLEDGKQFRHVADDFERLRQPVESVFPFGKTTAQRRLRRRAQQNSNAEMPDQRLQNRQHWPQMRQRQHLRLVQHDHATSDVVQLAAARRIAAEQRLEKLHVRRHHHRALPVFRRKRRAARLLLRIEIGMVLEDVFRQLASQRLFQIGRRLLDDAGIRDCDNNALFAPAQRMFQREGERSERLAAAGRHRQREKSRLPLCGRQTVVQNVPTAAVHRRICRRFGQLFHEKGKRLFDLRKRRVTATVLRPFRLHEGFRVEKIRVGQARKQHPHPEMEIFALVQIIFRRQPQKRPWQRRLAMQHRRGKIDPGIPFPQTLPNLFDSFRLVRFLESADQRRAPVAVPVGKAGVMPGNRIGQRPGARRRHVHRLLAAEKITNGRHGAGDAVLGRAAAVAVELLHTLRFAAAVVLQVFLPGRRRLPEIVQPAGDAPPILRSERAGKIRRQPRDRLEMGGERLFFPRTVFVFSHMGKRNQRITFISAVL